MTRITNTFIFALLLLTLPQGTAAFVATFNTLPEPYGVHDIDITEPQSYFGELDGYPDTYQFVLETEGPFAVSLWSYAGNDPPMRFAGILVRERAAGGVEEVARLRQGDAGWEQVTDKETRLSYLQGPTFERALAPGTYRFEVSNPENVGRYMLQIGEERGSQGYFATLADLNATYDFHDRSIFGLLFVPHVYLPLGIVLLVLLIYLTVLYRKPASS